MWNPNSLKFDPSPSTEDIQYIIRGKDVVVDMRMKGVRKETIDGIGSAIFHFNKRSWSKIKSTDRLSVERARAILEIISEESWSSTTKSAKPPTYTIKYYCFVGNTKAESRSEKVYGFAEVHDATGNYVGFILFDEPKINQRFPVINGSFRGLYVSSFELEVSHKQLKRQNPYVSYNRSYRSGNGWSSVWIDESQL